MAELLLGANLLPEPVVMATVLNSVVVQPQLVFDPITASPDGGMLTQVQQVAMIEAWLAGLTAPEVILFTNNVIPTPLDVLASLTAPSGTWYAEVAAVAGQVYLRPDGRLVVTWESVQFNYTGASAPETVYGWGLKDTTV